MSLRGIPEEQQLHREALGRAFDLWLRRNKWSQQVLHDWARATGSPGPWNSQASCFARATLDPKSLWWVGLAAFNKAVAEQDFKPITSRTLRDRLTDCEPFLNEMGEPATATDFFSMFIGEQELHPDYVTGDAHTDEEAKAITERCQRAFRDHAKKQMLSPIEAWASLERHLGELNTSQVSHMREVLSGWAEWTAADLDELDGAGITAMKQWGAGV